MSTPVPVELRIPPQDGAPFTRFATRLSAAAAWCDALPMADPSGVAQTLCDTLNELNRAPVDPELRYELLETLRPSLTQTLTLLDRMLVNQPLVMPPRLQALAALSDQIGGLACTAYSICVMQAAREPARITRRAPARLVCEALEHALHYGAHKVVLALNLQLPIESRTWSTLHQTYLLGERYRLTELTVPGAGGGESSIRNTWLVPLLLACCQTGQLLRGDIAVLHAALRESVAGCRLRPGTEAEGLFAVDLNGASPRSIAAAWRCRASRCGYWTPPTLSPPQQERGIRHARRAAAPRCWVKPACPCRCWTTCWTAWAASGNGQIAESS
jgi:hypothetical protein